MGKSVDERHMQERRGAAAGEQLAIVAGLHESSAVIGRDTAHEFLNQQAFPRPLVAYARDEDEIQASEVVCNGIAVARFGDEIEFLRHRLIEIIEDLGGSITGQIRPLYFRQAYQMGKRPQIGIDKRTQSLAPDLDDDGRPVLQDRPMDLRD